MSISDNIKNLRIEYNLTQTELGKIAGVSGKAVWTWENGLAEPRMGAIQKIADYFNIKKSIIIDDNGNISDLPSNAILPSAKSIPIMGTICAGDGIVCEDDYSGNFIIDADIKADYCLRVQDDSMQTANIFDGDLVFIKKDCDIESGKIYAVEKLDTKEAHLKKISLDKDSIILTPCNADYHPIVTDFSEVRIVGECIGVLHKY